MSLLNIHPNLPTTTVQSEFTSPPVTSIVFAELSENPLKISNLIDLLKGILPELGEKNNPEDPNNIPPYTILGISNPPRQAYVREQFLHINTLLTNALTAPLYKDKDLSKEYIFALTESIQRGYSTATGVLLDHSSFYIKNDNESLLPGSKPLTFSKIQFKCYEILIDSENEINIFDFLRLIETFNAHNLAVTSTMESGIFHKLKAYFAAIDPVVLEQNNETVDSLFEKSRAILLANLKIMPPQGIKC
ncbi:MAG: hypothetical protein WC222_10055 [Parachlamydiales bacterium]|jgi:hypothetical protein